MAEVRYLISDASKQVDVESHVLRYWEDELELNIPRNDMGHRYYTEYHIHLFRQIKELKEKGYQLKAIKNALNKMAGVAEEITITEDYMEEDMKAAWHEGPMRERSQKGGPGKEKQTRETLREKVRENMGSKEPLRNQKQPGEALGLGGAELVQGMGNGTSAEKAREAAKTNILEFASEQPVRGATESDRGVPAGRTGEVLRSIVRGKEQGGERPGNPAVEQGKAGRPEPMTEKVSKAVVGQAEKLPLETAAEDLTGKSGEHVRAGSKISQAQRSLTKVTEGCTDVSGNEPKRMEKKDAGGMVQKAGQRLPEAKSRTTGMIQQNTDTGVTNAEKMARFQSVMNHIIGRAMDANMDRLVREVSDTVSEDVTDKVMKEMEYLMRVNDEKEEERFRQLDETIRAYQKQGRSRAEAAAAKVPFFKKKKFGRSGKKMF